MASIWSFFVFLTSEAVPLVEVGRLSALHGLRVTGVKLGVAGDFDLERE